MPFSKLNEIRKTDGECDCSHCALLLTVEEANRKVSINCKLGPWWAKKIHNMLLSYDREITYNNVQDWLVISLRGHNTFEISMGLIRQALKEDSKDDVLQFITKQIKDKLLL